MPGSATVSPAALTFEVLEEATALDELRTCWDSFLKDARCTLPYLALDWVLAWSEAFGAGPLRFCVVRSDGCLVAAAPFVLSWRTLTGLPVRALHSPSLNNAFSEIPVSGGQPAFDALLDGALAMTRSHVLLLRGTERGSPQETWLRAYLAARRLPHTVTSFREVRIDTSGGLEAYRAARRGKLWSNLRNRRRRLEALGRLEVERHRPPRDPERVLAEACAVSMRSWKFREGTAIALLDRPRRFFSRLLASPITDVWILRLAGRPIAFRIMIQTRGVVAEIEIAYDDEFRSYSPGTILAAESNEALVREGVREISSAGDHAWKDEWSPGRRTRLEFVIFRPGLYPRLLARAHAWRVRASGGEVVSPAPPLLTGPRVS